jgi:hypothetical protein
VIAIVSIAALLVFGQWERKYVQFSFLFHILASQAISSSLLSVDRFSVVEVCEMLCGAFP